MLQKVISGGQTGIDVMGLFWAHHYGISTGGEAPCAFRTEAGPNLMLRDLYGLTESKSSNYAVRTLKNVQDADGTVLFGNAASTGSKMTISYCKRMNKPHLINPMVEQTITWLDFHQVRTLNVAGNRASTLSTGNAEKATHVLSQVFKRFRVNAPDIQI